MVPYASRSLAVLTAASLIALVLVGVAATAWAQPLPRSLVAAPDMRAGAAVVQPPVAGHVPEDIGARLAESSQTGAARR